MYDDEELIVQMCRAGAKGYLLKGADGSEVCRAVRAVHAGGEYYCPSLRQRVNHLFRYGKLGDAVSEKKQDYVTVELEIIRLICRELTSKEIAEALKMTARNVEYHKERIQEKIKVHGSVGIAVYALNNWLLY